LLSVKGLIVLAAVAAPAVQAPAQRSVFVTAAATDGRPLGALTAADVRVREGGQPRQVVRIEPSRATLQVAVVVEELLAPDNDVRRSVANFIDKIRMSGQLALYVVSKRTERRVDYTSEILPFANAINRFPVRAVEQGNVVQALYEVAKEQRAVEGRRAIVVVAQQSAQVSNVTADTVTTELRATRGVLYAATLAGFETSTAPSGATSGGRKLDLEGQVSGLDRDRLFNDGTRQTGGLHLSSQRTAGLWDALERIASELQNQYVLSFEGDSRSDGSVAIESARAGLTVRGPTRIK
jgi:VWFA-related protein